MKKLIKQVLGGDEEATCLLCNFLTARLKKLIFRKIDNPCDAEEVLQDTLISILDSLPLFRGKSSFLTWSLSIARHEIVDYYRKKKIKAILFSHLPFLEDLASIALGPQELLLKKELTQEIKKVLEKVSEGYRKILRLKYIEGCSVAEIAREMDLSPKAIESRLTRAREAFKLAWRAANAPLATETVTNDKLRRKSKKILGFGSH
ncbi:MAG: RNA polymerase sigma factor [Patescibacteria group bacterium]